MTKMEITKNFNIEEQYQFYLMQVKVKEEDMGLVQQSEMRKCFFAGFGQSLLLCREGIGAIENEQEAIDKMRNLMDQVNKFFNVYI